MFEDERANRTYTSLESMLYSYGWRCSNDLTRAVSYWSHAAQELPAGSLAMAKNYTHQWFDAVMNFNECAHVLHAPKPPEPTMEDKLLAAINANTDQLFELGHTLQNVIVALNNVEARLRP